MESVAVDGDVVVVPAEGCEVVGFVGSSLGSGDDVVDFEAVGVGASVYDAAVVSGEDGPSEAGAYLLFGCSAEDVLFGDCVVFGAACAVDEVDCVGSDSGSSQDVDSLFIV